MNIIELKKINKYFGSGGNRVHVLKNIDLQIERVILWQSSASPVPANRR